MLRCVCFRSESPIPFKNLCNTSPMMYPVPARRSTTCGQSESYLYVTVRRLWMFATTSFVTPVAPAPQKPLKSHCANTTIYRHFKPTAKMHHMIDVIFNILVESFGQHIARRPLVLPWKRKQSLGKYRGPTRNGRLLVNLGSIRVDLTYVCQLGVS